MPIEILVQQGATRDYSGTLYAADGVTGQPLNTGDKLRIKIGQVGGATPDLDLVSGTPTANGSSVTITSRGAAANPPSAPVAQGATYTLHLAQGDTALLPLGPRDIEIDVVDSSDTAPVNSMKPAGPSGVLSVIRKMAGATG